VAAEVFISYARSTSKDAARALKAKLGDAAFLDEQEIELGEPFPLAIFKALLESRAVVVFVDDVYFERWFCRREWQVAIRPFLQSGGTAPQGALEHVVVVLAPTAKDRELDHLPPELRKGNWPSTNQLEPLATLVKGKLDERRRTLRERIAGLPGGEGDSILYELQDLVAKPEPLNLGSSTLPVYPSTLPASLGDDFVGRADELARIHQVLATSRGTAASAALTGSIEGFGGMGKTRLALEYVYRYGPKHFPGGVFWVDADRSVEALPEQFHGILRAIQAKRPQLLVEVLRRPGPEPVPALQQFLEEKRDARQELADVLGAVADRQAILYVVDNVPEPALEEKASRPLDSWCPAIQRVALLVTSRQKRSNQGGIQPLPIDDLPQLDAVRLLKLGVPRPGVLTHGEWVEIAEWVGRHPLALDLLNQVLRGGTDAEATELLRVAREQPPTPEVDERAQDLVTAKVDMPALVRNKEPGIRRAFALSYAKLSPPAQEAARLFALLAPSPIPETISQELEVSRAARMELVNRHFILPPGASASHQGPVEMFGSMHRLVADYLQECASQPVLEWVRTANAVATVLDQAWSEQKWDVMESWVLHVAHLRRLRRVPAQLRPDEVQAHLALAFSNAIGFLGRREEALAAAQEAASLCRGLAKARPDAFLPNLAMSLNNASDHLGELGLEEEGLAAVREAVEVYRKLAQARPDAFLPNLAMSLNNLSSRLGKLGRSEEGLAAVQEAVEIRRKLAQARPKAFLHGLALSLNILSNRLGELGRREEGLAAVREAVEVCRKLAQARPDAFLLDLASSLHNLSLGTPGRSEEGLATVQEAVEIRRKLAQARPETFLPDLALSLRSLSNRLGELGRREEGLAAVQEAVEVYRKLAQTRPVAFLPDLASSLSNLSVDLGKLGRREEGLAAAQEAVEIRRKLTQAHPDAFLPDLASSLHNPSVDLLEALARRQEMLEALAQVRPDASFPDLASLHNLSFEPGRLERLREERLAAVEIRRKLAQARADAFLLDLASSLNKLSSLLGQLNRVTEARIAADEAEAIRSRIDARD